MQVCKNCVSHQKDKYHAHLLGIALAAQSYLDKFFVAMDSRFSCCINAPLHGFVMCLKVGSAFLVSR